MKGGSVCRAAIIAILILSCESPGPSAPQDTGAAPRREPANKKDWSGIAADWERKAKTDSAKQSDRARFFFNAATAMIEAALPEEKPGGETIPTKPDFDKIFSFLERASALDPSIGLRVGKNWEIARELRKRASETDNDAENSDEKGESSKAEADSPGQGQGTEEKQDLNKLAEKQKSMMNPSRTESGGKNAEEQKRLAEETGKAGEKNANEKSRDSLAKAERAMEKAAQALRDGNEEEARKSQVEALSSLEDAIASEKAQERETEEIKDISEKERQFRQMRALMTPKAPEQVEKNW